MSMDFDVLVVGAGPGGALVARDLARARFRVGLLDKQDDIHLGKTLVVDVEKRIFDRVDVARPFGEEIPYHSNGTRLFSPGGQEVVHMRGPSQSPSLCLNRFVQRLAKEAVDAGASFHGGYEVTAPVLQGDKVCGVRWRSSKDSGEISASIVVDATGYEGALVRQMPEEMGFLWRHEERDKVIAANHLHEIDLERAHQAVERGIQGDDEVWIRLACHGNYSTEYSFLSTSANRAYILIGLKSDHDSYPLSSLVDSFRTTRGYFGKWLYGGEGPIRVRRSLDQLVSHGFMVVGEAACQVMPTNGSGVASALYAGSLASEAAIHALRSGDFSRKGLWSYAYQYQTTRGKVLAGYDAFKWMIESFDSKQVCEILEGRLVGPEDLEVPEDMNPASQSLFSLFQKASRLVRRPSLWKPMASMVREILAANKHYANYPEKPDPNDVDAWRKRSAQLMKRLKERRPPS